MFDKFGAMTFNELLSTAEQLKDKGDIKSLTLLAKENGLNELDVDSYLNAIEGKLATPFMAAFGKISVESEALTAKSPESSEILDGLKNLVTQALIENSKLRIPVHNPDKHLIECYGQIIKEAARDSYRLPDVLVEAAGLPTSITYIGDLPEKKIYKIIANYYGGEVK